MKNRNYSSQASATDYYPFGSPMPGRSFSTPEYRFGFNGMEKDDELKGQGNSLDFGARIYDSRTGRFLSLDPLSKKFPSESNYSFASNMPIVAVDKNGEHTFIIHSESVKNSTEVKVTTVKVIYDKSTTHQFYVYNSQFEVQPREYTSSTPSGHFSPIDASLINQAMNLFNSSSNNVERVGFPDPTVAEQVRKEGFVAYSLFQFSVNINPVGRLLNKSGAFGDKNVMTGENLGNNVDKAMAGGAEIASITTLPITLIFNSSETILQNAFTGNDQKIAVNSNQIARNFSLYSQGAIDLTKKGNSKIGVVSALFTMISNFGKATKEAVKMDDNINNSNECEDECK